VITSIGSKAKSSVVPNGFIIIIINIAALVGGFVIGAVIQNVYFATKASARGEKTSGEYQYVLNTTKDGVHLEEYFGSKGGSVVIPATVDGLPVVGIGGRLFFSEYRSPYGARDNRKERITSVTIPDTVTTILGGFENCTELKQITLPKNLKYIGPSAFKGSGLTSITIPEGITDIANVAFSDCTSLTSVTLPRSLERMGGNAFSGATALVDVRIPSGSRIVYGSYYAASASTSSDHIFIEGLNRYFRAEQGSTPSNHSFNGCTSLSAASQQAIRDSGYTGEF
jgi:hypothetical protein